jgi:hypothetical protein
MADDGVPAAGQERDAGRAGVHHPAAEGGECFEFVFEPGYRVWLSVLGITPSTASVTVTAERLTARFGPWTCSTELANVAGVERTGPYRWYRVIGPHLSLADRGLTFGTKTSDGLCVRFREPVAGLDPFGLLRHPGLTVTVADPDALARRLRPAP